MSLGFGGLTPVPGDIEPLSVLRQPGRILGLGLAAPGWEAWEDPMPVLGLHG